jgi:hypothetical protein
LGIDFGPMVFQRGLCMAIDWLTLLTLALMFWSQSPSPVTMLSKHMHINSCTSFSEVPSRVTEILVEVFLLGAWVFHLFIVRMMVLVTLLSLSVICWINWCRWNIRPQSISQSTAKEKDW